MEKGVTTCYSSISSYTKWRIKLRLCSLFKTFFLVALLIFSACAPTYKHYSYQALSVPYETQELRSKEYTEFAYQKIKENWEITELLWEETDQYKIHEIKITWVLRGEEKSSSLKLTYLESKLPGKKKTVIVLPIYSRKELHELLPKFLTYWLTVWNTEADFNLIYVNPETEHDPLDINLVSRANSKSEVLTWMKESARKFRNIIAGLRTTLDWAETKKYIDIKRIGIVGMSTGASIAVAAAGIDPRIAATVFFLGGINTHDILSNATEPRVKRIRELIQSETSSWPNFLEQATSLFHSIDSLHFAGKLDPAKTLYFDAEFDEYISESAREEFWIASRRPERITFSSGHKDGFLALTPLGLYSAERKIMDFFRKKL